MSEKKLPTECGVAWEAHALGARQSGSLGRAGAPPRARTRAPHEARHRPRDPRDARDPRTLSKGAALEAALDDAPVPPLHALHGGKVLPTAY